MSLKDARMHVGTVGLPAVIIPMYVSRYVLNIHIVKGHYARSMLKSPVSAVNSIHH